MNDRGPHPSLHLRKGFPVDPVFGPVEPGEHRVNALWRSRYMNFDYGDRAIAKTKDDTGRVTEQKCVIVGITPIDSEEQAKHFNCPVRTLVYTVEFGDGTDALVLEADLQPMV
jgi:hypothetical protein